MGYSSPALWMTEGNIRLAREMWAEGVVASEIAALMGRGCTKSALLGYAHRQGWPPRPSPIGNRHRTEVVPRVPHKQHTAGATAPAAPRKSPERRPVPVAVATPPAPPPAPVVWSPYKTCQWIEGHGRLWAKCGAPTTSGAYCADHYARCYHRSARQEMAAA